MSYTYTADVGDGIKTIFPFSFAGQDNGYLSVSNIQVFVAGTSVPFTVPSNDPNKAYLTSAPPVGAEVLIRRIMPKDVPYSDFSRGNPFSQDALNFTNLQQLYVVQEILDGYLPDGFYWKGDVNMGGHKLINLGEGTEYGDSVNWDQWKNHDDRLTSLETGFVDNVGQRTLPWYYIATGGETVLEPPYIFQSAIVYINGIFQNQNLGAFSISANKFTLAEPLVQGDEVYVLLGSRPAAPDDYATHDEVLSVVDSLRADLASPTGAYSVGFDGSTVGDELNQLSSPVSTQAIYKEFIMDRSLNFSGYSTALATIGGTFLMPQGFDITDDDLVFVNMVSSDVNPALRAIVVYDRSGNELTWFYIEDSGLQSLSVTGSLPLLKLYDGGKGVSGYLQEYTLTSLPAAGSTVTSRVSTGVTGLTSLFHVRGDLVACFSSAARIGNFTNDDSVITVRELSTGNVRSTIQVSRMVVGFTTGTMYGINLGADYQTMCWKLQGLALNPNGNIILSVGGYWETGNNETKPIPDLGAIEINAQGDIVRHSVIRNQGFREWLVSKGYNATRTECEGVTVDKDGNVITLLIGQFLPSNTGHNLFLCKEFGRKGVNMSKWFATYKPLLQGDLENPIRASNGRYENPLLHAPFGAIEDLFKYIVLMNIRKFCWFSQIEPQLVVSGVPWNGIQKYEIFNLNNSAFILTVHSTSEGYSNYRVDYSLTAGTYTVTKIRIKTNALHTDTIVTDGNVVMTLDQGYWYPQVAGALTLGTAAKPFNTLYVQTAPVVGSDRKLKDDVSSISDKESLLATRLKSLVKSYRLKSNSSKLHYGVIAQDVIDAFTQVGLDYREYSVVEEHDDTLAVNYTELLVLVISAT